MNKHAFIGRDKDGRLEIRKNEWIIFRNSMLMLAKNKRELEFIGQLVEDLQAEYEEKLEEYEENE